MLEREIQLRDLHIKLYGPLSINVNIVVHVNVGTSPSDDGESTSLTMRLIRRKRQIKQYAIILF